ncbi:hypothetical protein [Enterococcus hirae]|uniref:hypothetical protein n=1 Tax=Enterococcus hirae TaxID=1354 RepID=UPI00136CA796|nr:hypothetical protein [Enterococcus hirae]NAE18217.1 hypothetical protein [Enterococcus hirae]
MSAPTSSQVKQAQRAPQPCEDSYSHDVVGNGDASRWVVVQCPKCESRRAVAICLSCLNYELDQDTYCGDCSERGEARAFIQGWWPIGGQS